MKDLLECAMGLDIHRDTIVACLLKGELDAKPEMEIRSFGTMIPEMQKLRAWLIETDCRYIAMESTGIYWQPVYETLETCFDGDIHHTRVRQPSAPIASRRFGSLCSYRPFAAAR